MNDDEIRSELERRAASTPTQPDWAKRVLLPAVWHEVDARPQPVITSRWPSLAGAAALVVALLVLVVAVPRLAPQPPAATPPTLEVLTTQSLAAAVRDGSLEQQTVLVDGAIVGYDGPVFFGGNCGPNGPACLLGQLEGVEPRLLVFGPDLAVVDGNESPGEQSGWPSWKRVTPPLRGMLMVSVHNEALQYVGRVVLNGDQLTWSPGEVKTEIDINARELDEIVLVNGWLAGIEAAAAWCPPVASPIPGLPRRDECGKASWLADEPVPIDPLTEPLIPPSAVQVQAAAFATYAPDPSARVGLALAPQRAVYGVARRLYGNGCIDPSEPCWDWSVVGRLSQPAPDVTPPSLPVVPTPEIAPSPTPPPASGPTYACTGPEWEGGAIELTDHLGVIESCVATRGARPEERTVVSEISRGVVGVTWQNSCMASGASLDLWPREEAQDRPRYVLMIDSRPLDVPGACRAIGGVTVEVTFMNAELAPENLATDVEAHLMMSGAASDATEVSGGWFNLTLSAGATQYSNDDPIDIQAQLLYEGDQPTIDLSGTFSLVNGFGIEQLDGDHEMAPGWDLPCVPHQLRAGERLVVPYEKSAGWSEDDPNADFYRAWVDDPELHLPPGTWLVTAYSNFTVGSGCSGEPVHMQASIVITVVPGQSPSPSPTPAANVIDCAPLPDSEILSGYGPTTIHDETGLVESCETVAPTLPPGIYSVFNPDDDRRLLQVHWGSSLCDARADFYLRSASGAPGYTFQGTTYDGPCRTALVTHEIRLHLSGDINAGDLTSWWTRLGDSSSSPSPLPDAFDCSETVSILLDRTGLVESCSEWTPEPGQSGVSQGPDASSVFVAWTYTYCRGAPFARFEHDGDRYVFELDHIVTAQAVQPSCEPVTRTVGIAVRFKQPLDVGLIDVVSEP